MTPPGLRWGFVYGSTRRHAFLGGYSLCGKHASNLTGSGGPPIPSAPGKTPEQTCAACYKESQRREGANP